MKDGPIAFGFRDWKPRGNRFRSTPLKPSQATEIGASRLRLALIRPSRVLEGFSAGALHPLTTPVHLLVIVALGLLTGQRSPLNLRTPFIVFVPCLTFALIFAATGRCISLFLSDSPSAPPYRWRWRNRFLRWLIGRLLPLRLLPSVSIRAPKTGSTSVLIKALLGTGIIVIFLVFDIAYYASLAMRKSWPRVGVRVFGSWIIAISLMVLALSLFSSRSQMALQ
jgi:urease accessory protein